MDNTRELILEVLEKGFLMSLATIDEGGLWASVLIYVFDADLNLYWLSLPSRRHSVAIEKDPRAAATITLAFKKDDDKIGLQVQGNAQRLDHVDSSVVESYAARHGKPSIDGQIFVEGQSWYCLRPTKIDLIHQPLFRYEKKFLELP